MNRIIILLLLFFIGPIGCENCSDHPEYFDIQGIRISNAKFTGEGTNPWTIIDNNESIEWNRFFMRVGFEKSYYHASDNAGGSNLYADCLSKGFLGSEIGVDTFYLVTITNYNYNYSANDTLNNAILINNWTGRPEDFNNFFSVSDYIEQNKTNIPSGVFEIKITEPPLSQRGDYQFRLIYILTNGEVHITTNNKVRLY